MNAVDRSPPPVPLPGLPGGQRAQRALVVGLAGLVLLDRLWLRGMLFGHHLWDMTRWGIAMIGLLVGALAYCGLIP